MEVILAPVEAAHDDNDAERVEGAVPTPMPPSPQPGDEQLLLVAVQRGDCAEVARLVSWGIAPSGLAQDREAESAYDVRGGADGAPRVAVLVASGQNVNRDSSLHFASISSHTEVAALLLDAGCSPNHRNVQGHTPLHYAVRANNGELVRLLMRNGADPDVATLKSRNTPLHRAATLGCAAALEGILHSERRICADPLCRNDAGHTPREEAALALEKHVRRFSRVQGGGGGEGDELRARSGDATGPEQAQDMTASRGVVFSRRRKRGAAGFHALATDPEALSARTAELKNIVERLEDAEFAALLLLPTLRLAWAKSILPQPSGRRLSGRWLSPDLVEMVGARLPREDAWARARLQFYLEEGEPAPCIF